MRYERGATLTIAISKAACSLATYERKVKIAIVQPALDNIFFSCLPSLLVVVRDSTRINYKLTEIKIIKNIGKGGALMKYTLEALK